MSRGVEIPAARQHGIVDFLVVWFKRVIAE
jgi:hypothetical protein